MFVSFSLFLIMCTSVFVVYVHGSMTTVYICVCVLMHT